MKSFQHITEVKQYDSEKELPDEDKRVLLAAHGATSGAYAPYSGYRVGAAVLLENDDIVTGNNQENMAYPSGLCAERVAIFWTGAHYPGVRIRAMAIVAGPSHQLSEFPGASCGACRQSMLEYEMRQKSPIRLIMQGNTGPVHVVDSVAQMLPLHFSEDGLKKH